MDGRNNERQLECRRVLAAKKPTKLTVAELVEVNKVLHVKATSTAHFRVSPIKLGDAVFLAYGDSGWANAPGNKSQGGYVVMMTDKEVVNETRQALRSTLAAEAASEDCATDMGTFMACAFTEMASFASGWRRLRHPWLSQRLPGRARTIQHGGDT
ncbi:unnamed protein product [Effrenium voratum]|uniref:Uncharacterized protein n=1 Tax=Effrenium voratum TaxID=2562239 RepID=A0AA36I419_9DINO|nr:unnamed protein product [Effrenium voratum]